MKKYSFLLSTIGMLIVSIVLSVGLYSEGGSGSDECDHDPETSKTVTGCCNVVSFHNMKPICVDGSGQACPTGTCGCDADDEHIFEIPL